jgi:heme A synthase
MISLKQFQIVQGAADQFQEFDLGYQQYQQEEKAFRHRTQPCTNTESSVSRQQPHRHVAQSQVHRSLAQLSRLTAAVLTTLQGGTAMDLDIQE